MDYDHDAYEKLKDLYESGFILEHEFLRRKQELGITEEYIPPTNSSNNNDNGFNLFDDYQPPVIDILPTYYNNNNNNNNNNLTNNNNLFDDYQPPVIDVFQPTVIDELPTYNNTDIYYNNDDNNYQTPNVYHEHEYNTVDSFPPPPPPPPPPITKATTISFTSTPTLPYLESIRNLPPPIYSDPLPPPPPPIAMELKPKKTLQEKPNTTKDISSDRALDMAIIVKDNYKVYGNIKDKIIVYYKSLTGNYQSEPIEMDHGIPKSWSEVYDLIKEFCGRSEFNLYRIPYQIYDSTDEEHISYWNERKIPQTFILHKNGDDFKEGGHFLVKPQSFQVHRSSWSPSIQGTEMNYLKHGYVHSQTFAHQMLSSTTDSSCYVNIPPSNYYDIFNYPKPTPFTTKLQFFYKLREMQLKYKKSQIEKGYQRQVPLTQNETQLVKSLTQSTNDRKCFCCANEISDYLLETNVFLCMDHFDSKLVELYRSIDFTVTEGNVYSKGNEVESHVPSVERYEEEEGGDREKIVVNSERFCLFDVNEIVFLNSKKSIKMAFDDLAQQRTQSGQSQDEDGIIREPTISVTSFLTKANRV
ncbi:hypothetical protein DLAC_01944 [Tieghemostelium lacteum]|uniref:Uncharacterized protein n=1 Tax=Tieghemostelium lacteum TaxID=361077 RepID=A0A152A5H5_TIELA|nr:hypothetical protein DLAC_01944 [Tieghemostelium lacteum]|eukprot:KYR01355.1 hypothetical protein DLAC_01944 [Tieghemostelium lacteum]